MSEQSLPQRPAEAEALLLTARQAAKMLTISERSLWTLTEHGQIPCVRISKRIKRYRRGDLLAYVERAGGCG